MSKVAIVILNWNGRKLLEQFLPSVVKYSTSEDVEIVVADNFSTDDSIHFLQNNYPQIRYIQLSENYGYAGGYNKALEEVDAEYFVLLNSDVEVTENWLQPIVEYLDVNEDVAAVQPKILAQRDKSKFEYAGAAGGYIDKYGYPFCRGRIFSKVEEDKGQYDNPADIFWASGACLIIRSKDFMEAGGFDASFFAHMEEIDLCWRLNARGRRVVCLPLSKVYHVGAATLSVESPRKTFLNFRNNLLMLYKNLPQDSLYRVMWIRVFLDYLAAIQFFLKGNFKNAGAVFDAHSDFLKIRKKYRQARNENLAQTIMPLLKTIYPRSILFQYHVLRNKIFSKLQAFN